jgi:hypothetical protein
MVFWGSSTTNFRFLVSKFLLITIFEMLIGSVQKAIAVLYDLGVLIQTKSTGSFLYHLAALKLVPAWNLVGDHGCLEFIEIFNTILILFNLSGVWSIFARFWALDSRGIESLRLMSFLFLVFHLILHQDLILFLLLTIFFLFINTVVTINQRL